MMMMGVSAMGVSAIILLSWLHVSAGLLVDIRTDNPVQLVNNKFVSYTIDQIMFGMQPRWDTFNFSSPRVATLMSGLSPAYLRLGGSPADWSIFTETSPEFLGNLSAVPKIQTFNKTDVLNLLKLTSSTQTSLLFELNLQLRYGDIWDPTNAIKLLDFIQSSGHWSNLNLEMGNEPNAYPGHAGMQVLSGERMAHDYDMLLKVASRYPFLGWANFVGPDTVGVDSSALNLFKTFVNTSNSHLTAATFHHYYFHGPDAKLSDYINPKYFSDLENAYKSYRQSIADTVKPWIDIWLGETSDSWGSGTPNITDRFASGFLWMDKLGLAARLGIGVVMRQTFYGGNYPLIGRDLYPNPDYWLSYVHKQLCGIQVLDVRVFINAENYPVRVYAHCTKPSSRYSRGAVTGFALNVQNETAVTLNFSGYLGPTVDVYEFTPAIKGDITSRGVLLNGKLLEMVSDTKMPTLTPTLQKVTEGVKIKPLSYSFFVFSAASVAICG